MNKPTPPELTDAECAEMHKKYCTSKWGVIRGPFAAGWEAGYATASIKYFESSAVFPEIPPYKMEIFPPKPKSLDWTKPIQTRDGKKARLVCSDLRSLQPYIVAIETTMVDKPEYIGQHSSDGRYSEDNMECGRDIINVPEVPKPKKRIQLEYWVNLYKGGDGLYYVERLFASSDAADSSGYSHRIKCVRIVIDEEAEDA